MTLILRMARLLKADAHGVLDWLEEPEAVLKQAVRDMEAEIEHGERVLKERVRKADRLHALIEQLEQKIAELDGQIDICFAEGNETLARTFIRKKLEVDKRLQTARRTATDIAAEKDTREQTLREQKEQLNAIVEKMQLLVDETHTASARASFCRVENSPFTVSEKEVDVALLHEKRQRASAEGRA